MSYIDDTIARVSQMQRRERDEWRKKANNKLKTAPTDPDATRLIAALDKAEMAAADESNAAPRAKRLKVTGKLAWEAFQHGGVEFRAFHNEHVVGRIFMHANHKGDGRGVYSVTIKGQDLPGIFRSIDDARKAGEDAFTSTSEAKRTDDCDP